MPLTDARVRLALLHEVAAAKVKQAGGAEAFWREVEAGVETIAAAKIANIAPVNENLLGLALMLLQERRRLTQTGKR